jgi:uncharacterized membrane protein YedE/YeeE
MDKERIMDVFLGVAISGIVCFISGFVFGIGFGRKNPKKVEAVVDLKDTFKKG